MKRAREIDGRENTPSCIALLRNQPGYFGWEGRRQRGNGDGTPFGAISDLNSSREVRVSGTQPAACSGSEFSEGLVSHKQKNVVRDGLGKLEADPKKERRKIEKRKKHRPKVVEVEKTERKPKMEIPMPPQTPKQKTPMKRKGRLIGRRTFARKKIFGNSLADNDEWDEAGDQPKPGSVDEGINPSSRVQIDEDALAAEMDVESRRSGLFVENSPGGFTHSYGDVNIGIDELLQELAKLPTKSSSPPLHKADLLQLNIESPLASLSYIVDNIRIPCLLDFVKQARRKNRTKAVYKLGNGRYDSANKVLEDFMCVFKNFLPNLLLKNDTSSVSGQMFDNKRGGKSKKNFSGSKELKATGKRKSMPATHSNFEIVPYTHLHELSSKFQPIETSCTTPMTSNFTTNVQKTQTSGDINHTLIQNSNITMELALQSVVHNLRSVDLDEGFHADDPTELQSAIVPFVGGGMIVPYIQSSEQVKQKTHRAEVLLDPETDRMWRLLKENKGEHNVEGMDSCNLHWWENERQVFLGRAKSFTARMNLILGDRRFSPWKGSIVDSVVGVFLTQNVSDHLSSSAFMSLAAKFPVGEGGSSERKPAEQHEETSTDSMACLDDIPCLSNCVAQDTIDIQLNGHPMENMAGQSYYFQNSLGLAGIKSENSMVIDVDGCTSEHVEITSKAFYENAQNECRDPSLVHSESTTFSSINKCPIDTMDAEMEATTCSSSKLKAQYRFEKNTSSAKKGKSVDEVEIDWEGMRRKIDDGGGNKVRSYESLDSVNWEAVRNADVNEVSEAIRERGMNNLLAERIKDFLNRLVRDHGSIDLEWLKNLCPDDAKKYLLSIRGLGLKSVECVRLLALKNVAFPVDTNVARISVRLGWVPLKPLPESLQLHLLELYPVIDSVQKYIWPRLCKLDQKELYELHYHMITFGKVFCTKNRPNCKICPMRGECKHFNSAKLALPAPDERQFITSSFPCTHSTGCSSLDPIPLLRYNNHHVSGVFCDNCDPVIEYPPSPIIEEPPPSQSCETLQILDADIEDAFYEDDEIPTIKVDLKQFGKKLQNLMQENDMKIPDKDTSKALVELTAEAASIQARKLKHISGLRTEHHVYELPDSHFLLEEMDQREPNDPSPYLLAIWTPGETARSIEPPYSCCETHETGRLCESETCFACNSSRELEAQTVRGTLLIPCRTAMRGRFPLNGTYFQTNEVFADHDSSRTPIQVPRSLLWNLPRRIVYFGTSIAAIFRGFTAIEPIRYCFSKGFVCVRGFDRTTREPKPLYARLHLPRSKEPHNKKPWVRREE